MHAVYTEGGSGIKLIDVQELGGASLRQRHLVAERLQVFDQVTPESSRIQGGKWLTVDTERKFDSAWCGGEGSEVGSFFYWDP